MIITYRTYVVMKWLLSIAAVFFMLALLIIGPYYYGEKRYSERYFPGTRIAGQPIGGLLRGDAEALMIKKIDEIKLQGVTIAYYNREKKLPLLLESGTADAAGEIVEYDLDKAMAEAYAWPREGNHLEKAKRRLALWREPRDFDLTLFLDDKRVADFLDKEFGDFSAPARDASLVFATSSASRAARLEISQESDGQVLDNDTAIKQLREKLVRLDNSRIFLEMVPQKARVLKTDCEGLQEDATKILEAAPYTLEYEGKEWKLSKEELTSLLTIKPDSASSSKPFIGLDYALFSVFLDKEIAKEVDRPGTDAKFEIENGKVKKFQAKVDGLVLDREDAARQLEQILGQDEKKPIALKAIVTETKDATDEMADLGIKEILGTGKSNFSGSPRNRRHNIKTGAASVNGTLIAPDEEFSLIKTLGSIDAKNGYLPELVIKEGKTLPEYGGGLCQIGTTVFRGTVQSGLPVTMRRNHSYRVGYYEPAGTDATIYDPWPDYRFKNDTGHHVLIQSRFEGDNLFFDFWGTKDGRQATSTYPTIYNIVKPAPTKMIETLDLKPGEKKCTETSHNGADAYFDYKVTYPDGRVEDTRFKSHYVPWQAVCLIGVDKLTADKEKEVKAASSTESIKN